MTIFVVNISKISNSEIEIWINQLHELYSEFVENVPLFDIVFSNEETKQKIIELNDLHNTLSENLNSYILKLMHHSDGSELSYHITDLVSMDFRLVVLFDRAYIEYQWGVATELFAVIKHLIKSNIWHELSHLFGAEDHYDETNSFRPKHLCDSDKCIMRYGLEDADLFCKKSKGEISDYFKKYKSDYV